MSDPSRVLAQAAGTLTTVQAVINLVAGETWSLRGNVGSGVVEGP